MRTRGQMQYAGRPEELVRTDERRMGAERSGLPAGWGERASPC